MQPPQVIKSNALIEASYRLTPAEQRIMLACIAQVRRDQPITDDVLYSVSAADIAKMTCSHSKTTYDELAKAALRLKRREVWLTERANGDGSHEEILVTGWVQSIRYRKHEGRVELRFTKDMLPYLTQLTEQFTRYALEDVAKMTSSHAIRLYELLAQWREAGKREVEIDWLREAFQLDDKYPAIKDFKRWVIVPAVEQINEHSPLQVTWEQRKTGRRITHLTFSFSEKAPEGPPKWPKWKTQSLSPKKVPSGSGAIYGIPMAIIKKKARPNELYEDTALRLLDEAKQGKLTSSLP